MFRTMYAALPDGPEHWPVVLAKFSEMLAQSRTSRSRQLARISAPTLVLVGDDDMITLEHSVRSTARSRSAELAAVPVPPTPS